MICYMLVILCKCTMWCFNKLRNTQWVRGYPVGLEQGKHTRVSFFFLELENFQRSDYHQLTLPDTFCFSFFLNFCGEAQACIHHQSIKREKRWFPTWYCCFTWHKSHEVLDHLHLRPSSSHSEPVVSSLQPSPVWSVTLQMSRSITKHYAQGTITPQLGVTNFAVRGRAERRKAIM